MVSTSVLWATYSHFISFVYLFLFIFNVNQKQDYCRNYKTIWAFMIAQTWSVIINSLSQTGSEFSWWWIIIQCNELNENGFLANHRDPDPSISPLILRLMRLFMLGSESERNLTKYLKWCHCSQLQLGLKKKNSVVVELEKWACQTSSSTSSWSNCIVGTGGTRFRRGDESVEWTRRCLWSFDPKLVFSESAL